MTKIMENINNSTSLESSVSETSVITIDQVTLQPCVFILFAEYLGYESPLADWCEEWCTKDNFPNFKKRLITIDAQVMFQNVLKDYTIENLHHYYNAFYDIVIKKWEDNLSQHDSTIKS